MSVPQVDSSSDWSETRHYGGDRSAGLAASGVGVVEPEFLPPLAGPGDSAVFAVAMATGHDPAWSAPVYHGPRRRRPPPSRPHRAGATPPSRGASPVSAPVAAPAAAPVAAPAAPGLLGSSAQMAVASLASRLTGFVRTLVLAAALGAGSYSVGDAYNLANTLPNMVYELLLGGVLTSVIIPVLVKAQQDDTDSGVGYTQRLISLTVAGLGVGTVLAVIGAPLLIDFFGGPRDFRAVATLWATLLLPEIFFYGVGAILSAVLNTRDVYGWPAWAPVLNNIVTIATVALFVLIPGPHALTTGSITNAQILLMGIGTTAGIAVQAVVLIVPLRRLGFTMAWRFRARPNELGRMSEFRSLSLWVLGYVAISQVGVVVINSVALRHSAVSIFAYADLLFQVPYGILGVSLLTALMPRMSRAAAAGDVPAVLADLRLGARLSAVALLPITAALIVFAPSLTTVILIGRFSAHARVTGVALACGAFGLLPFALVMLQQRVFYANRDTRTPTLINLVMVATKVVAVLLADALLSTHGVILSLTVSTSLSYVVGAVAGHVLLRRRFGLLGFSAVARAAALIAVPATIAAAVGLAVVLLCTGLLGHGRGSALVTLLGGGALALTVFATLARRLPLPEVSQISHAVGSRLRGNAGASSTE